MNCFPRVIFGRIVTLFMWGKEQTLPMYLLRRNISNILQGPPPVMTECCWDLVQVLSRDPGLLYQFLFPGSCPEFLP